MTIEPRMQVAAAGDPSIRDQWMTAKERTQALLDAARLAALESE
jgi:hypothetical protein